MAWNGANKPDRLDVFVAEQAYTDLDQQAAQQQSGHDTKPNQANNFS